MRKPDISTELWTAFRSDFLKEIQRQPSIAHDEMKLLPRQ